MKDGYLLKAYLPAVNRGSSRSIWMTIYDFQPEVVASSKSEDLIRSASPSRAILALLRQVQRRSDVHAVALVVMCVPLNKVNWPVFAV